MAARPWISPDDVREYTEVEKVKDRTDARLLVDITRAEQYVITYTHNDFSDYEEIPSPVRTAVLILAENYGHNAVLVSKGVKSETFDDYSYTAADSASSIEDLGLAALLDDFVKAQANNSVTMRMRKL